MNWYYVEAGKQAGPVDDAQLDEFSRSGKIQPDTLVWREGMANWQAYREIKPTASDVPEGVAAGGAGVVCSECGKRFPPDQVISYGGRWVCGACKPIFLQRMREGVALPAAGPRGTASEADLLARDYVVDVGGCLSRAWELFKGNAGILIGCSVLVYLALVGVNLIPYLSVLLALIFQGPLLGGLWVFYPKK